MIRFLERFAADFLEFAMNSSPTLMSVIERFNITLEVSFTPNDRMYGAYLAMNGANDYNQIVEEMLNITESMMLKV